MLSATRLIHSIPVDEQTGAIAVPIYATSTFVQEAPGINKGFDYARTSNPTRKILEELMKSSPSMISMVVPSDCSPAYMNNMAFSCA
jgi:cystathionine beta-lyase/cystathionine gamma-synthase